MIRIQLLPLACVMFRPHTPLNNEHQVHSINQDNYMQIEVVNAGYFIEVIIKGGDGHLAIWLWQGYLTTWRAVVDQMFEARSSDIVL